MVTRSLIENEITKMYATHPIMREIKFKIRDRVEQLGKNYSNENLSNFKGGYLPQDRTIVISGENHQSLNDVRTTIKHELYGHAATYMINREDKKILIASIKLLENDPSLKKYWDHVNTSYSHLTKDQKAEEVYSYIAEQSKAEISFVRDVNYNVKSLDGIKSIANHIKNEMLQGRAKFLFRPEQNYEQFRKAEHTQVKTHNPETIKEFLKQSRSEHAQVRSITKDKGLER